MGLSLKPQNLEVEDAYADAVERICSNEGEVDDEEHGPPSSIIQQFYEGANVFVTGATGFLGMALVEKLLRSCPGISKLFLLIRSRKGKTAEERANEMFLNRLFSQLLQKKPTVLEKVRVVSGDIEKINLGISKSDTEMLKREVNIVFNVAATVRFDEAIRKSFFVNVTSLKTIIALAESMPNLKAFVHTSTAFSHCHHQSDRVQEKFYPAPYTESQIEALLNSADDPTILCLSKIILGRQANTYLLTKAMGEEVLRQKVNDLPIAIYRPSVVMNTYKEPVRGWNCAYQGAGAVLFGLASGILRVLNMSDNKKADFIPVDKCACALVALPWHINSLRQKKVKITPIFNHVTDRNTTTWGKARIQMYDSWRAQKLTSKELVWVVHADFEPNRFLYNIKFLVYHILPLPLFTLFERLQNMPPRLRKIYIKTALLVEQLRYFTIRNWTFDDSNIQQLWSSMPPRDRHIFHLDVSDLDWDEYFNYYGKGFCYYVMNKKAWEYSKSNRHRVHLMIWIDRMILLSWNVLKLFFIHRVGVLVWNMVKNYAEYHSDSLSKLGVSESFSEVPVLPYNTSNIVKNFISELNTVCY